MEDNIDRWMGFLPVLGMPTSVLKYGGVDKDTKYIFLIIPGNPGIIEYYDTFMKRLYEENDGKIPVWGVSHAGHVMPVGGNQDLYKLLSYDICSLEGQIRHKVAFISENISKDVRLILIGHSVGCYVNLKIMDHLEHRIQRCFHLFPTIERMAVSPNGVVYTPTLRYFRWLSVPLMMTLSILPTSWKKWIIKWRFSGKKGGSNAPECVKSATLEFIKPYNFSNSAFMAHEEMQKISDLDQKLVEKHMNCSSFYYGQEDNWCPQQYYRDLVKIFPDGDIRLCAKGYSHAFVIDASVEMADIVNEWSKKFI